MTDPVLTPRRLNRALLARQHLLERSALPLTDVVEQMGFIQMQYAPAGYIGLWSRMQDFRRPMLTRALEERRVVQGTMLRGTIHTVSAADYWPAMAGVSRINREWFSKQVRVMAETDMPAVARAVREELAAGPLRIGELSDRIAARGFPPRAAFWASWWVELLRVPPSGTWERRRADLYALADAWLPRSEVSEDEGMAHLVRRYLGAFGPAPIKDIASWMGVNVGQMRHVVDSMALRTLRDEAGGALLDLPDAPLPPADTPAPVRFIAVWDAMLLVHARRTQVLPEVYRSRIFNTKAPHSFNTFLVDGAVAGTWRFEDGEVQLSPFETLEPTVKAEVEDEAHRLSMFHAD